MYVSVFEPPDKPASYTVIDTVSPAVALPPTAAVSTPFGFRLISKVSVAVLGREAT